MWKCCVFRAMFEVDMRERGDGSVTLGNQCSAAVSSFLDFAYSGEALITDGNIDMLFQIASFLQVIYKYDYFYSLHPSFIQLNPAIKHLSSTCSGLKMLV